MAAEPAGTDGEEGWAAGGDDAGAAGVVGAGVGDAADMIAGVVSWATGAAGGGEVLEARSPGGTAPPVSVTAAGLDSAPFGSLGTVPAGTGSIAARSSVCGPAAGEADGAVSFGVCASAVTDGKGGELAGRSSADAGGAIPAVPAMPTGPAGAPSVLMAVVSAATGSVTACPSVCRVSAGGVDGGVSFGACMTAGGVIGDGAPIV
jgi:hypothetical protein